MNIIFIFFIFFSRIFSQNLDLINNSPINILGKIKPKVKKLNIPNSFDSTWVDSLSLHLPCKGIPVPPESLEDMLERVQKEEVADELGIDVKDLSE